MVGMMFPQALNLLRSFFAIGPRFAFASRVKKPLEIFQFGFEGVIFEVAICDRRYA